MECAFSQAMGLKLSSSQQTTLAVASGVTIASVVAYRYMSEHCQPGWMGSCLSSSRVFIEEASAAIRRAVVEGERDGTIPIELLMDIIHRAG